MINWNLDYKYPDPSCHGEDIVRGEKKYRRMHKREFGEVIRRKV